MDPMISQQSSNRNHDVQAAAYTPSTSASSASPDLAEFPNCSLEPIAIIGMGCRLPGDIKSPSDLWNLIVAKSVTDGSGVPPSRFNMDAYQHVNNERPGSFNVPGGYFLQDSLDEFDPTMFNLSPVEAAWMDPQQRKLLEVVYEAFESSGCTLEQVSAAVTGCFVGSFTNDFQQMALKEPDFRHSYATTGIDPSIISNRISHVFNLRGPSALINTACSSSMYALHSGCNAIRNGECEGAVVGGANLILTVDQHMNTAKLGVLSPSSACHTFDESADGYGRAEGMGALYIKSLAAAVKNGDPIRAIIRSTATNSNGRLPDIGITHPSLDGQVDVISTAYRLGDLDSTLTSYIECHGTGTAIGDPIEVHAISLAMRSNTNSSDPILIGSVKPNIGHSEASSSISTIIKAVLAIENNVIPPTAGLREPNKRIKWDEWHVKVVTELTSFPSSLPVRRVGVNAFGYGGTNGHAIIDNVESVIRNYKPHKRLRPPGTSADPVPDESLDRAHLLVFSAHDKATLKRNIEAYSKIGNRVDLLDLSHTLSARRSKLSCRAFTVCRKQSYITDVANASDCMIENSQSATMAFIFTGQGAQWQGMGAQLLRIYPSFLKTVRDLDSYLIKLPDAPKWTIEASLADSSGNYPIDEPEISQPLCTAIQIALVNLLDRWGVVPIATVGHSSGEIAAAYAAGYISEADAMITAYYRGKAACSVTSKGAMLAVGLGAVEVGSYIMKYDGRVVIACYNSPTSTTLSGDADVIEEVKSALEAANVFAKVLKTGNKAYHSYHMEESVRAYRDYLSNTAQTMMPESYRIPTCHMISSVTGSPVMESRPDIAYWTANLVSPVLFSQAIQKLMTMNLSVDTFIEIGPHSALSGPIREICKESNFTQAHYLPTLKRDQHDGDQLLKVAGSLWARNAPINIDCVTKLEYVSESGTIGYTEGSTLVDLPTYQWTYSKNLRLESTQSRERRGQSHPRHDLLGRKVIGLPNAEPVWRNILRHKDLPWLKHHSLGGEAVFPASGYIAMAIEAMTEINSDTAAHLKINGYTLRNIVISAALVVPDDDSGVETLFSVHPHESIGSNQWYCFNVSSRSFGAWKHHTKGIIGINMRSRGRKPISPPELPLRCKYEAWNRLTRDLGFDFGPAFHCITEIRSDGKTHAASADMILKQECGLMQGESRYALHPGCIDSCLQILLPSIYAGRLEDVVCGTALTHFEEVSIWPPSPSQLSRSHASVNSWTPKRSNRTFVSSVQLVADDGELLADFVNVRATSYEAAIPQQLQDISSQDLYMQQEWTADTKYSEGVSSNLENPQAGPSVSYSNAAADSSTNLATTPEPQAFNRSLLLIYRENPTSFLSSLTKQCNASGWNARSSPIKNTRYQAGEQVIMLTDLEGPLLATLQDEELKVIQNLIEAASSVIWITCGGLISGHIPEYGMTSGFARVLRAEKQSLDLVTLDFNSNTSPHERVISLLMDIATRQATQGRNGETEYCIDGDTVYVNRLVPSKTINEQFGSRQDTSKLISLKEDPALRGIVKSGKIFFRNDDQTATPLGIADVEIKVIVMGLNARDSLVNVTGSDDSGGFNHDIAGIVTAVGSDVSHVNVGNRVTGFAFDTFATRQRTLAKLVQPIPDCDSFQTMATLPTAFATAFYGLYELARVGAGEVVLILDGNGPAGLAAIQLCKLANAKAVIVTSCKDTIDMLGGLGISPGQIISLEREDILTQIHRLTGEKGIDVVFSSSSADQSVLNECCKGVAPFGRFIIFGKRDVFETNTTGISITARGSTVFTFDLEHLYEEKPDTLARLLESCMQLYKCRKITTVGSMTIKDISEINEVEDLFSSDSGAGKVVISYEPNSLLKVLPTHVRLQFRSDATYLLVGCLGGLGRCLASWMAERGAKHIAFLSRSGEDNPSAAALVTSIRALGVDVLVLRGDITSKEQIQTALKKIDLRFPIRGVVNAAVVLQDCMFQNMSIGSWRKTADPKVKGSLNLHEVFSQVHELDFFVMTSSTAATLGSIGQSNYAAANTFLDALAHHRRAQDLPAISITLPMILGVGYIAEHPEIEALVRWKGMSGIDERELLAVFEIAMMPQPSRENTLDHLIVGLEPSRFAQSLMAGKSDALVLDEPRFRTLVAAMKPFMLERARGKDDGIIAKIKVSKCMEDAVEATIVYLVQRLSRLLMIEREEFRPATRSIASYGLDSMIGAEFRNWIFREFKVDMPFQQLLAGNLTLVKLATHFCEKTRTVTE